MDDAPGEEVHPEAAGARVDFAGAMSYGDYLDLDVLLGAQHPRSASRDELLFIIQHQTSELWLKLALHELRSARERVRADDLQPASRCWPVSAGSWRSSCRPGTSSPSVLAAWLEVYRDPGRHWDLYELAEELVDLEDAVRVWRFRHLTTVERIIGTKRGSGGTAGVGYLRHLLDVVLFPELWAVRTEL